MRKLRRKGGKEYEIWQLMVGKHFTGSQHPAAKCSQVAKTKMENEGDKEKNH